VAFNAPDPGAPRFARGTPEFDRALAFFDGTYAVALTLLVTTLDSTTVPGAWADLAALWAAIGSQIVAFFVAFAIVAFYWRSNHAFVARLHHLSGRLITVNLVLLAFVVLLPFSTDALGEHQEPLATAVFAGNVAVISATEAVMSLLAWRNGLPGAPPSPPLHEEPDAAPSNARHRPGTARHRAALDRHKRDDIQGSMRIPLAVHKYRSVRVERGRRAGERGRLSHRGDSPHKRNMPAN